MTLSGTSLTHESEHFVVHYSLEGADATTENYMNAVADALETAWNVQINDLGWAAPPPDVLDNDPRYDVYLVSIKDRQPDVLGYTWPEMEIGDNPNTPFGETRAASSYIILENDLAEQGFLDEDALRNYMIATVAHEFNHAVQAGYDEHDPLSWIYEATASWMEAVTFGDFTPALEYLPDIFYTPEICLGASSAYEAQDLSYGRWLLLYTLADRFGEKSIKELWQNVAEYDGYESLDRMLASYDSSIPDALANYHARTLARDFPFAGDFNDTVWTANTITGDGDWTTLDEGVQELGAGFFYFKRPPGLYQVHLSDAGGAFEVWAITVGANEVQAVPLGRGGTFSTEGAKYSYLMVFNSLVNEKPEDCHFYNFTLHVGKSSGTPAEALYTFDASHFIQPEMR